MGNRFACCIPCQDSLLLTRKLTGKTLFRLEMSFHVKFQRPQADVSNPTRQRAFELSFWRQAMKGIDDPACGDEERRQSPRAVLFAGPLVITADSPSLKVNAFPAHAYRLYPATAHSTHLRSIRWRASRGSQRGAPPRVKRLCSPYYLYRDP